MALADCLAPAEDLRISSATLHLAHHLERRPGWLHTSSSMHSSRHYFATVFEKLLSLVFPTDPVLHCSPLLDWHMDPLAPSPGSSALTATDLSISVDPAHSHQIEISYLPSLSYWELNLHLFENWKCSAFGWASSLPSSSSHFCCLRSAPVRCPTPNCHGEICHTRSSSLSGPFSDPNLVYPAGNEFFSIRSGNSHFLLVFHSSTFLWF